ncbi:MAG: hypothetical protein IKL22_00380 [Lachnospiraceae bacterium]|nr:hypothetical protein [Lachnospiraceae bacterium]
MSTFYVGITDSNWFSLLREDFGKGILAKQVNFGTPGTREFKVIESGDLFLFKLHNKKLLERMTKLLEVAFLHYEKMTISD